MGIETRNKNITTIISMPTTHNVFTPLRKQYKNVEIHVLAQTNMIDFTQEGIRQITKEIVKSTGKLPKAPQCNLILTGHPLINIITHDVLKQKYKNVNILTYDNNTKKYLIISDISQLISSATNSETKKTEEDLVKTRGGE